MYKNVTYDTVLDRMLSRVSSNLDKREGAVIWDTLSPTAIEFQILYIELDNIIKESFGDTASREFLILRCKERGIEPYEATKATLLGYFTPDTVDVTGKRFSINDLNFVVTGRVAPTVSNGYFYVECETPGTIGNQYLGNMIPIEYIDGLQTAELRAVATPGTDDEDTEELRKRYLNSFQEFAFGGNRADYYNKVKSIGGVGEVKIERVWNKDIVPTELVPTKEITNWYDSIKSTLSDNVKNWLSTMYETALERKFTVGGTILITIIDSDDYGEAKADLISKVQQELDPLEYAGEGYGVAPIGHIVNVKSAAPISIQTSAKLILNEGVQYDDVKDSLMSEIKDYLLSLRKEWVNNDYTVVRLSQIEARLVSVDGVTDISDLKINNKESNLTLGKYEIPIFSGAGFLISGGGK